jgi:mannose-6-phosphate isomerase-like protein (cupin superfamily)/pyrroloquinoline quinone (PQQ) biosynthesis protein C
MVQEITKYEPTVSTERVAEERGLASDALQILRDRVAQHSLWSCALLRACATGHLTRDDLAFIFSQYHLYSKNFTRFLAAAMANFESDAFRASLSRNLWEESGMLDLSQRHSELFRVFLREGLAVDPEAIEYEDSARYFATRYLDYCTRATAAEASSFLALGTEAIVVRLYSIFVSGLRLANVPEGALKFFLVHIECDDEHAKTLEDVMLSYAHEPGWLEAAWRAADYAMTLRKRFFDHLFECTRTRRLGSIMAHVQARRSLCDDVPDPETLLARKGSQGEQLYGNRVQRLNIDFSVYRLPFAGDVLDPRIVRVKPGANNELHKHAHETVFVFFDGDGEVRVNGTTIGVHPGDMVFVPRWAMHQTVNVGARDLLFLAVTDYGLTGRLYVGDYLRTARLRRGGTAEASAT